MAHLNQKWRFLAFALNVGTFYLVHVSITGRLGIVGGQSAWVIAAIGAWVLGLVSAPWFRPPRDALAAAIGSVLILATLELPDVFVPDGVVLARNASLAYGILVGLLALTAGSTDRLEERTRLQGAALVLSGELASGSALFGGPALISIFGFYDSVSAQLALTALWFGFALVPPYELMIKFGLRLSSGSVGKRDDYVGRIRRIDDPNVVRVALDRRDSWFADRLHVVHLPGGDYRYLVPLYVQVQESEVLGTGLCLGDPPEIIERLEPGGVYLSGEPNQLPALMASVAGGEGSQLAGFIVEGSRIGEIKVELAGVPEVEEGTVLYCQLRQERVFYQILDAKTAEESFVHNPRGTHIASALQLGTYRPDKGFSKYPWLPTMNTPVFIPTRPIEGESSATEGELTIGVVPGTGIPVTVNLPDLIEFHSAILGVTGTGKTELTFDIVRAALACSVKVVCVDLTGEYQQRLDDCNPVPLGLDATEVTDLDAKLFDVETGAYGAGAEKKVLKEFLEGIHSAVKERVSAFLGGDDDLAIFQLAEVTNTKVSLRTTELFLTEIMMWARRNTGHRPILIVLEEAHTTIPETAGAGFDFDTKWVVDRIGQIALQGQKYGVGLLLISQRTALVSKTILSQCNTFFVHALVDQTSLGYLSNVLSSEHVQSVPNLRFLEFIAYGKAVNSERPILTQREFDQAKQLTDDPSPGG